MNNPCNNGDPLECERWKNNFPREYKAYEKRMQKYENSGKLKKYQDAAKSN